MNIIKGVGLLLFSPNGKLLVLKELSDKPEIRKMKNMLSFPLETVSKNESWQEALARLSKEEIGRNVPETTMWRGFDFEHPDLSVHIKIFTGKYQSEFTAEPSDTDVVFHKWMHPEELLREKIRIEVSPIINTYLHHTKKE